MRFSEDCLIRLEKAFSADEVWKRRIKMAKRIHLAIFQEPYLSFIYEGKKTIETRFAQRPCPPFHCISTGDVVLLKSIGYGITGVCTVNEAWFYDLDKAGFDFIRERFAKAICPVDETFWNARRHARCATLILVANVTKIPEFEIRKRDRRGWVILYEETQQLSFGFCRKDRFRENDAF